MKVNNYDCMQEQHDLIFLNSSCNNCVSVIKLNVSAKKSFLGLMHFLTLLWRIGLEDWCCCCQQLANQAWHWEWNEEAASLALFKSTVVSVNYDSISAWQLYQTQVHTASCKTSAFIFYISIYEKKRYKDCWASELLDWNMLSGFPS